MNMLRVRDTARQFPGTARNGVRGSGCGRTLVKEAVLRFVVGSFLDYGPVSETLEALRNQLS